MVEYQSTRYGINLLEFNENSKIKAKCKKVIKYIVIRLQAV